jgi:hypothetical protein
MSYKFAATILGTELRETLLAAVARGKGDELLPYPSCAMCPSVHEPFTGPIGCKRTSVGFVTAGGVKVYSSNVGCQESWENQSPAPSTCPHWHSDAGKASFGDDAAFFDLCRTAR